MKYSVAPSVPILMPPPLVKVVNPLGSVVNETPGKNKASQSHRNPKIGAQDVQHRLSAKVSLT